MDPWTSICRASRVKRGKRMTEMQSQEQEKDQGKRRDRWGKIEIAGKCLGAVAAVAGAIFIPYFINKSAEENRKTQTYAVIMSQREAKDSDIRAEMFKTLLSGYLKVSSDKQGGGGITGDPKSVTIQLDDLNQKIVFLSLLVENFQEYFSARHLLEDLYVKITEQLAERRKKEGKVLSRETKTLIDFRKRIIGLARTTASKQTTMLSRMGLVSDKVHIKEGYESSTYIPLFELPGEIKSGIKHLLNKLEENQKVEGSEAVKLRDEWWKDKNLANSMQENEPRRKKYAIKIETMKIESPYVKVSVSLHEYHWERTPAFIQVDQEPFVFHVSYFDLPYMDNTRLFHGERFAIVLKTICEEGSKEREEECRGDTSPNYSYAIFQVVTFREEFMSLRDRPLFEEMLKKMQQ
jgi:hypothetical protein